MLLLYFSNIDFVNLIAFISVLCLFHCFCFKTDDAFLLFCKLLTVFAADLCKNMFPLKKCVILCYYDCD